MLCANLVAMGYDFTEVAQQLAHRGYTGRSTVRIIILYYNNICPRADNDIVIMTMSI